MILLVRVVAIQDGFHPRLEHRDRIRPGVGEILIRMRLSGLCGTDLFKLAAGGIAPGTVLGHEVVGEVLELGAGADSFSPGDRVVVPHHLACGRCRLCLSGAPTQCPEFRANHLLPGGFADEIRIAAPAAAHAARRLPAGMDDLDAVFLEPAACVVRSIERSGLTDLVAAPGRGRVAILGGGSMGLLHLLVLRAQGLAIDIILVEPRPDRRELALRWGARAAFPPGDPDLAGLAADAAFDCVGGGEIARVALELVRPGGTVVLFAHGAHGERPGLPLNELFKHEKRLVGAYSGSLREQDQAFELLASGALRPSILVSHPLALDRFEHGVDLARRQEALKVVFHP